MADKVLMPKLGLTMTEGTLIRWKKKEGEKVEKGDILFEVETSKSTNEIESDFSGVLMKILVNEGETVPCTTVIAYIGEPGEKIGDLDAFVPVTESADAPVSVTTDHSIESTVLTANGDYVLATPYAKKLAKEKGYFINQIVGTGPKGSVVARDVMAYIPSPIVRASPVATKMAAELGVDLANINKGKRIMKADVKAALISKPTTSKIEAMDKEEIVKLSSIRKTVSENMLKSWMTSPRVTYTRSVDVTEMKAFREKLALNLKSRGIKLTFNHIFMKVIAKVLVEFPEINASLSEDSLTLHPHANIGIAVALPSGLVVPNVKECDIKTLSKIAMETEKLIEQAKAGKLNLGDITGGTFTISNLGAYGIINFSPIINQPELAILGVCAMVDTPVVRDGQFVIRTIMNLNLSADHRVVDGAKAAGFLQRTAELLENPYLILV